VERSNKGRPKTKIAIDEGRCDRHFKRNESFQIQNPDSEMSPGEMNHGRTFQVERVRLRVCIAAVTASGQSVPSQLKGRARGLAANEQYAAPGDFLRVPEHENALPVADLIALADTATSVKGARGVSRRGYSAVAAAGLRQIRTNSQQIVREK